MLQRFHRKVNMNYIIVDTETTGLPNKKLGTWPKMISIALIHTTITNGEMDIYSEDEYFVTDWVDELQEDTGKFLNLDKATILKKSVPFDTVKTNITKLINECGGPDKVTFVAHNASFDYNVIKTCGLDLRACKWFCTMTYGYLYFKQNKYPKLLELAKLFNISVDDTKLHGALYDTQVCCHIFYCIQTGNLNTKRISTRVLELRNRSIEILVDD